MSKIIHWNAVFQSVKDTWMPLIGVVAVIIAAVIVIQVVKKYKK